MNFVYPGRALLVWWGLIAFSIACSTPTRTLAQGQPKDKELAAVFEDWKFRQGIMKSVRYVLKGSTEFRDGVQVPGNPIQPRHGTLLIDLVKRRYHFDESEFVKNSMGHGEDEPQKWKYAQRIHTTAFDGKQLQSLRHRKANGIEDDIDDLHISKGKINPGGIFEPLLNPIFFTHGIVGTVHKGIVIDNWPLNQDPDDFRNQGEHLYEGMNCLVLRTDPFSLGGKGKKNGGLSDEFWINKEQKSAIHRYFYFNGDNPWFHFEISWKETPHGWWVDEWSNTWRTGNTIRWISRYQIESMEVNPEVSDADFILKAEPGMKVTVADDLPPGTVNDPNKPYPMQTYRISPTGSWIELSSEGLPKQTWGVWIAWIAGVLGCGILALIYRSIRRRR